MQSGEIDLRGQKVEHSEYSEGMITNHTAISVTVAFSYGQKIRSFLYPKWKNCCPSMRQNSVG